MLDIKTAAAWRGYELIDRDGDKIGTIGEIYLDHETNEPEWATVKTGLFGTRQTFVPIRDAISEGEIVRVPFEKSHVKDAPNVDPEQQLSQAEERELYDHYGVGYSQERSGSQLPEAGSARAGAGGQPTAGRASDRRSRPARAARNAATSHPAPPTRTGKRPPYRLARWRDRARRRGRARSRRGAIAHARGGRARRGRAGRERSR